MLLLSALLDGNLVSLWPNDVQEAVANVNAPGILKKNISDEATVASGDFVEDLLRFDYGDFGPGMHHCANVNERRFTGCWGSIDRP